MNTISTKLWRIEEKTNWIITKLCRIKAKWIELKHGKMEEKTIRFLKICLKSIYEFRTLRCRHTQVKLRPL
jgi:hypothetical protein